MEARAALTLGSLRCVCPCVEYGSNRYRLSETSPSLHLAGGTIVAASLRQLGGGHGHQYTTLANVTTPSGSGH